MSEERRRSSPDPREAQQRRPRLLVVDDELLLVEAIEAAMGDRADVLATSDPDEALASIDAGERYDAILLDVRMPGMDGLALFDHIAALSPSQARRVIFMTGGAVAPNEARLASLPNELLMKPLELARLEELLARMLRRAADSARMRTA
jgi:CheY-like chemotaxis protein